jgi:sarcosine oxidase, subunit gamma
MAEMTLTQTESAPGVTDISALRRSPAAHLAETFAEASVATSADGRRGVALREIPFVTMVGLRVEPDSDAAARIAAELGFALPAGYGQVTGAPLADQGYAALWLGPDEFLVVGTDTEPAGAAAALAARLAAALGEGENYAAGAVVELSANRTTLELAGPSARAALEKGCALDLHPRAFAPGTAAATVLGPVPVVLWKTGEDSFRIFPRASFADYAGRWLVDAMTEFAVDLDGDGVS